MTDASSKTSSLTPSATGPSGTGAAGPGWTGHTDIDAALIMLDRLDVSHEDDARVEAVSKTLRQLATQLTTQASGQPIPAAVLVRLREGLDDWLNTYASELCDEKRVAQAQTRIREAGGTIAYITSLLEDVRALIAAPVAQTQPDREELEDYPAKCPITRRDFFMVLEHPTLGMVPTYGGPFDSFTIPHMEGGPEQPMHERELYSHRFDHDEGQWVEDEPIPLRVIHDKVLFELDSDSSEDNQAKGLLQDLASEFGLGGLNGATPQQLAQRISEEFARLHALVRTPLEVLPEIDSKQLIRDCYATTGHAQGSPGCSAFSRGASWYRAHALEALHEFHDPRAAKVEGSDNG